MKIDIKSSIIGVLLTVVVFLALGATHSTQPHQCVRYLLEGLQNSPYVIDTTTGQVWSKGDREFWKPKDSPVQADTAEGLYHLPTIGPLSKRTLNTRNAVSIAFEHN
jgi:hypothetical protein